MSGYGHHGCIRAAAHGSLQGHSAGGRVRTDVRMSRYTGWGVGGPAKRFFEPRDLQDLSRFLRDSDPEEPLFWLGLGSNLLVRDSGFSGTVIRTASLAKTMRLAGDGVFQVGVGVTSPQFARFCAGHGYAGAEFFAGIPGTMGGALAMNAGAFGTETWDLVVEVEVMDRRGQRNWLPKDVFKVGYRHVERPPQCWFTAARMRPTKGDVESARHRIRDLLAQRAASQPSGARSCGSVFRNPPGDHAGRLVEAAGLKGYRIGGAQVSEKHANFIINTGNATATDIEYLIAHVQKVVSQVYRIVLTPEVHVIGDLDRHDTTRAKGDDID